MTKVTIEMNGRLNSVLEDLADREDTSKAQVVRRALTLMKLVEDQKDAGYGLALTKDGEVARDIVIP